MEALNPNKYGISVQCKTCHHIKAPVGRSTPLNTYYCDHECAGYYQEPLSGSLWPNESEADFGFYVGEVGTYTKEMK